MTQRSKDKANYKKFNEIRKQFFKILVGFSEESRNNMRDKIKVLLKELAEKL